MTIFLLRRRYSEVGGAERFTCRLARALSERGHEVIILAEEWPEAKDQSYRVKLVHSHGVTAYARAALACVNENLNAFVFSLERTLWQDIYRAGDGVHAAWLDRRAPYLPPWKRIFSKFDPKHRALLRLERSVFTTKISARVIANSDMGKREILQRFDYPADRIRVIHPGVDLDWFVPCMERKRRATFRAKWGMPVHGVVWAFVGSGFERKGLQWAIEIAAAQKSPPVLCVLGKGNTHFYRALAQKRGVSVEFLPLSTEARDVYHAADAFILPTIYDPCSNACLEAFACGLPVITTEANGAAERVRGVILPDPSQTERCAEVCSACNVPWNDAWVGAEERAALDEKPCWDAILELVEEGARNKGLSLS